MSAIIANPQRFVCLILLLALALAVVGQQPQQPAPTGSLLQVTVFDRSAKTSAIEV